MVRVAGLVKEFRDTKKNVVRAVDDISFEAKSGEIFGLIGDNGAGKTTTLRILSTVIAPSKGIAEVNGIDVTADPDRVRRSFGFVSGTTGLYGRLTPRETLTYFGGLYGLSGAGLKNRVTALIDELAIGDFADRVCDRLSTGQKQRVGIARTILHDPPVLFLDEPTSGLDVASSQGMLEFIEGAKAQGKTVIFCSHIMSEVERLCDRMVILHQGRITGAGTAAELKAQTGKETLEGAFLSLVEYYSGRAS